MKFRLVTALAAILLFAGGSLGIRAWACDYGCNYGYLYGCYGVTGECFKIQDICEVDLCFGNNVHCSVNRFTFCVARSYQCQFPSCTWTVAPCCQI
jgi:hypothetical protein